MYSQILVSRAFVLLLLGTTAKPELSLNSGLTLKMIDINHVQWSPSLDCQQPDRRKHIIPLTNVRCSLI